MGWALCWIIENFFRIEKAWQSERKTLLLFSGFVLFYFWILAGLLYSDNIQNGTLLIFRRLSLLVFPLILFSPGIEIKKRTKTLLQIFTIGTVLYLLICYGYAFFRSITIHDGNWSFNPRVPDYEWTNYFLGTDFTINQHPSYIAMYVIISIFIAFELYSDKSLRKMIRILWLFSAIFLIISVYYLSSRAAYLAVLVLLPLYLILKLGKKGLNLLTIGSVVVVLLIFSYVFFTNQRVKYFFNDPEKSTIGQKLSMDFRIPIWKSALSVIQQNVIFGVGIGDSCDELKKEFKNSGYTEGYYENLNAHNQYLEVLLGSGIIGCLIFISILGLISYIAIRDKNLLYGLFILMMLIFFMFESILNRIAGVTFFSLFSFLLLHLKSVTSLSSDQKSTL
jgi:O-antigen ligase